MAAYPQPSLSENPKRVASFRLESKSESDNGIRIGNFNPLAGWATMRRQPNRKVEEGPDTIRQNPVVRAVLAVAGHEALL